MGKKDGAAPATSSTPAKADDAPAAAKAEDADAKGADKEKYKEEAPVGEFMRRLGGTCALLLIMRHMGLQQPPTCANLVTTSM